MPYLRVYCPDVPLAQKRLIAQKLIEITLRTFHLRAEDRRRITIQFVPLPQLYAVPGLQAPISPGVDSTLEVNDHNLTEEKKKAFAEEARPMLASSLPAKPGSLIARLLGIKPDIARQVALQFNDLTPDDLTSGEGNFRDREHRAA
jgi:hypothetical protein